jgi:hypothetical protein
MTESLLEHNIKELENWLIGYNQFKKQYNDYLEYLTEEEMEVYYTCNIYQPHRCLNE